jgi:CubicO group peptidase (beta-lactamase class C family)
MQIADVRGTTEPGYEGLRDALAEAVALDPRGGAALSVVRGGRTVVELAAGAGAGGTPRTAATPQVCFSCTKGVVAVALLMLVERGELELDAPVARYWPAFAEHGKHDLLVRHVVSHTSGQPAFRAPLGEDDLARDELTEAAVASDEPWWEPGTAIAYQSLTYGALCGGLVRRVSGRSVGRFVADEIAGPLGLDLWIGLPSALEGRVAPLEELPADEEEPLGDDPVQRARALNPEVFSGPGAARWNTPAYHAGEIPGAGGIATATAFARLYCCLASGGALGGVRLLRPDTIELGRRELARGPDVLLQEQLAFGVGFMLPSPSSSLGADPAAFGHGGHGGQATGAWPTHELGFAFTTTALRSGPVADERARLVLDALAATVRT